MEGKKEISICFFNKINKYKRYCKCGHSVIITPTSKKNKVICNWCGNLIFKDDFEEFKEKLIKKNKELNNG